MYLAYFDESGDDGFPLYSSPLFILSAVYFNNASWKENYLKLLKFRKKLKADHNFPVKLEFHTRQFIQNKKPYHGLYSDAIRKQILEELATFIGSLDLKIINVAINKEKVTTAQYNVLENAFKYSIQRIENDMKYSLIKKQYIIITDEGRVGKMTRTSRAIQRINYIPSNFSSSSYREEIKYLIEDPLPKKSQNSYFIQISDFVSYIVNLYIQRHYCNPQKTWPRRVTNVLNYGDEIALLDRIKPVLNTKASKTDKYGVVCYPK
jgi:hypothetical protein